MPTQELVPLAVELLAVPEAPVRTALELELELAETTVIADTVGETACIFLVGLYRAERVIAGRIRRLANGRLPWPYIDPEKALPWVERKTGLSLAESQTAAIRLALISKVLIITGGPGVGKTTIVNSILRILAAKGHQANSTATSGISPRRIASRSGRISIIPRGAANEHDDAADDEPRVESGAAAVSMRLPMTRGTNSPAEVPTVVPMASSAPRCAAGVISPTTALLTT